MTNQKESKLEELEKIEIKGDRHRNVLDLPEVREKVEGLEVEKDGKEYVIETRTTGYIGKDPIKMTEAHRKSSQETANVQGFNIEKDWDPKKYIFLILEGDRKSGPGFMDYLARYADGSMKTVEIPDYPGLKQFFKQYRKAQETYLKFGISTDVDISKGAALWLNKILLDNEKKRKFGQLEDNKKMIIDLCDEAIKKYLAGEFHVNLSYTNNN